MVRSNLVSGVLRSSVLCEGLESRSLFAANAFEVKTDFGTGLVESGTGVSLLKDGRVLAVGQGAASAAPAGKDRILLGVYDKKGVLSKSFDGDGRLALSAADTKRLGGYAVAVNQAPDGGLLVTGELGVLKLKLGGSVDTAYGVKGFAGLRNVPDTFSQVVQLSNGTTRQVIADAGSKTLFVTEVDAKGKIVKSIRRTTGLGSGAFAVDAGTVTVVDDNKLYRFNASDLSKSSKFAAGGVLDLAPAFNAWAKKNGPWNPPYDVDDQNAVSVPPFYASAYSAFNAKGGGLGLGGGTSYTSDDVQATYPPGQGDVTTDVWFNVSPDGKTVSVEGGPRVPGKFLAKPQFDVTDYNADGELKFSGVVTKPNNTRVNVSAFSQSDYSQAGPAVLDGDGSFFIVGTVYDGEKSRLGLVHTKPV